MKKVVGKFSKKLRTAVLTCAVLAMSAVGVFADAVTPVSMLDAGAKGIINDFGADIVPTVIELIGILVPVGLTLWAIGFAVKKGIEFLQSRASDSIG